MVIFYLYIISILSQDIIIVIFSYTYTIIIGDMIMCADIPGSEEPFDVYDAKKHDGYMTKEEMKKDIQNISDAVFLTSVGIATFTGSKAVAEVKKGDFNNAKTSVLATGVVLGTGVLVKVASDELSRKIDHLEDDHNTERPPSPSVYGSDGFRSPWEPTLWEKIKEYFNTLEDYIIYYYNNLPDIINNIFLCYDNKTIVIYCTFSFLIFAICSQLISFSKNKVNKKINQLPYNNKYWVIFIKYKNTMNRLSNINLNILTCYCLIVAFLCILSLIFWF